MVDTDVTILIAEDDDGQADLIDRNLRRTGLTNRFIRFHDGQEILDFMLGDGDGAHREPDQRYLLLLDIRMPKIDGIEVLRRLKAAPEARKMPVIVVTTSDDPQDVAQCRELGCSHYITKPVEYHGFVHAIRQLGLLLSAVDVPRIAAPRGGTVLQGRA
ncbi:MAG: response regulator [Armatimonadetes bacterium]|nr:response regulator [Armatimonadota bacterium]